MGRAGNCNEGTFLGVLGPTLTLEANEVQRVLGFPTDDSDATFQLQDALGT